MNRIICFLMLALVFFPGCAAPTTGSRVEGYRDGLQRAAKQGTSQDYLLGYADGGVTASVFDLGYRDAQAGRPPSHPTNPDYVAGYKEGR